MTRGLARGLARGCVEGKCFWFKFARKGRDPVFLHRFFRFLEDLKF